jgi:hypothetical protein
VQLQELPQLTVGVDPPSQVAVQASAPQCSVAPLQGLPVAPQVIRQGPSPQYRSKLVHDELPVQFTSHLYVLGQVI